MIWVAFRHGLRVGELVGLRWTAHVDFDTGTLRIDCRRDDVVKPKTTIAMPATGSSCSQSLISFAHSVAPA
jgi:hypothetical protein